MADMSKPKASVVGNPWHTLRQFTAARIALGRAGVSQPTAPQLEFQLAHARARDAVHLELEAEALAHAFAAGLPQAPLPALLLHSAAENRGIYLQRPDLGRRLDPASRAAVQALSGPPQGDHPARPWVHYLLSEARRRGLSGVDLKEETGTAEGLADVAAPRFLL
jgi:ethanolamine ammonia-lyase small subunit